LEVGGAEEKERERERDARREGRRRKRRETEGEREHDRCPLRNPYSKCIDSLALKYCSN
jgi:hypothetical protein